MTRPNSPGLRSSLGPALLAILLAAPMSAATVELRALLDLDGDPGTGCTVVTVDGPFDGVEQLLVATVETTPSPGQVTALVRRECDQGTGLFGASIPVDSLQAPPWPVGPGNGVMGSDVVEAYFPLGLVGADLPIRIGLESDDLAGENDALLGLVLGESPGVPEIPTLSTWALLGLALLLASAALWRLRRRGAVALALLAAALAAGGVWAVCVLDGEVDDWAAVPSLGTDPVGDAPTDIDIVALFARLDSGDLCLRYDLEINQPPAAVADNYATDEDTPLNVAAPGVLFNDSDPDSDPLTAVLDTAPPMAEVSAFTLNGDGSFDLTPASNFNGTTSFTYHANDGALDSNTVTVTVTVGPLPDGPMAVDDAFATDEDTVLNITAPGVLNNDSDPENDPLQVTAFDAVSTQGATVSMAADGSFTYDPTGAANLQALAAGAMLDDTFTYTVEDNPSTGSDVGTVTVTVTGVDDPPTAVNDTATVTEDDPATAIDVLANDTDPDGGAKLVTGVTQPANGTVVNNTTDLTYQPNADYCNDGSPTDDFTYTITGGSMATVMVTVTCVNDPPMVVNEVFDVAAGNFDPAIGNTTLQFSNTDTVTTPHRFVSGDVLDNDSDPENDGLAIIAFDAASVQGGTVSLNLATGEFTYLPPVGFEGTDSFTYTVFDGTDPAMGTVTVEVADMVWYLDNDPANDGSGDDGRSSAGFDSITQFEAENGNGAADDPEAGDIIFIFQGTSTYDAAGGGTDGLDLLDQQKLLGEGVDLVVQSLTLVSGNPANQPSIDNTNPGGDAVSVLATVGNRTGIEIRGLSIDGTHNAIEVTSTGANQVGATISDNTIAGSGMEGIDLNPGSSGAFVVLMENNVFSTASPAGTAIDLTTAAASGDVEIALNANTNITSSGSAGIVLDNSAGGGDLFITGFAGNTVHGNTVGDGIRILKATFDADPSDTNFTGDEVSGGNTSVGSSGNPVGGSAMVLTNVSGDLAFGTLNLSTDGMGAVGLDVTGSGLINAGAGTGFEITSTGGTISSADGPAVVLDPLTAGLTFGSVSSASSPTTGVSLTNIAGTFSAAAGSITGATGTSFNVNGGTPSVTYNGSITHSGNATRTIEIQSMTGGSAAFGGAVSATDGTGIRVANNTGTNTVSFISTVDLGTGVGTRLTDGNAFTMSGNSAATTVSAADLDVFTNGVQGVVASGSGVLDLDALSLNTTGNGGRALNLAGIQSLVDVDSATCSNNSDCVTLSSLAASSATTFAGVGLTCTGGTCFNASSARTVEVTGSGNTIGATNAVGLNMTSTTIGANDATFESISASGAANGIVLNATGTSGGLTITGDAGSAVNGSGGTLTNLTGNAIQLTDTMSFAMDQLNMSSISNHGIAGVRVDGLSVRNATFTNMGDADGEDAFSFDRDTQGDNGLVGTAVFQNLTVTNFAERAIDIVNEGTGSLDLDILDVSADNNNDTFGEDAIRVQTEGSVNADVLVSGGTYNNLELDVLAYFAQGTGTNTVEVTGVTSTNGGGPDNNPNGGGVAIIGSAGSSTSFDINANSLTGVQGAVVQIIGLAGAGQSVTLNGTIGGPALADANTLTSDNADGLDLDFDGDPGGGSTIGGTILVQNNTINFEDDGIGVDHRDAAGTMNVTIRDNTLNGVAGDDASTADIDDGIFIFSDDDVGAAVNQLNVEIISNEINNVAATKNVIEVVDVRDGNKVCFAATGTSISSGSGNIELDTAAMADLVVDATSAANLSTLNNSIPVVEAATPTYNSAVDCIP